MRLLNLTATAHPVGNRIDLQWINPAPERYPNVHISRSNNTHPTLVEGQLPPDIGKVTITAIFTIPNSQFITSLNHLITSLNRRFFSVPLREAFSQQQIIFSSASTVQVQIPGERWQIVDVNQRYLLIKLDDYLNVYLDQPSTFSDCQTLQGETVYYYTLIPTNQDDKDYQFDWHNQTTAIATAPYRFDGQMYELLPALYHRYDTVLPPTELASTPTESQWGQLRRFLAIPGSQLDWLYSLTTTLLELLNFDKVDGRLLPLLANWIGWQTNYRQQLGIDHQRNEIRRAPYWYQTTGTLPTSSATLRRLFGWENRFWDNQIKELFHNVALSNRPEQLNFWALTRLTNTWSPLNRPLSLDFAHEGRAVAAAIPLEDEQPEWWLFYHTKKHDGWEIRYKTLSTLKLKLTLSLPLEPFTSQLNQGLISSELQNQLKQNWLLPTTMQVEVEIQNSTTIWRLNDPITTVTYFLIQPEVNQLIVHYEALITNLDNRIIHTGLQNQLAEHGWLLTDSAQIEIQNKNNAWWLTDPTAGEIYFLQQETSQLTVYRWAPSQPLSHSRRIDQHPTTGYCQEQLWTFWESYDPLTQRWRIDYLIRSHDDQNNWSWSARQTFTANPTNKLDEPQRRQPWLAVTETQQSFWLLWLEKLPGKSPWQLKYQSYQPGSELIPTGKIFPDSGPFTDLFALTLPDKSLWVFWAQRERVPTEVTWNNQSWAFWDTYDETTKQWQINYRYCNNNTCQIYSFTTPGDTQERQQPLAQLDAKGNLSLAWWERTPDSAADWVWVRSWQPGIAFDQHLTINFHQQPIINTIFRTWHTRLNLLSWQFQSKYYTSPQQLPLDPTGGTVPSTPISYSTASTKRWQIVYRVKNPLTEEWSPLKRLIIPTPDYDAREPSARVIDPAGNQLELFWSSNRSGSWSIWRGILETATNELKDVQMLTSDPYSQRQPLPLTLPGEVTWLLYRANDSIFYQSQDGTKTIDFRAAGSTTLDLNNSTKLNLRGELGDFQTYTYDTNPRKQRTTTGSYARDIVAIHITSDSQNQVWHQQDQLWLTSTLQQFLPIQVQVIFNLKPSQDHEEFVYTATKLLEESWDNQLDSSSEDSYTGLIDNYKDEAPDWIWLQALPKQPPPLDELRTTVDFHFDPNNLSERIHAARFRTCHLGLTAGGVNCGNN